MGRAPEAVIPFIEMTARMVHFFREKNSFARARMALRGDESGRLDGRKLFSLNCAIIFG
jgi:hypothetical protein